MTYNITNPVAIEFNRQLRLQRKRLATKIQEQLKQLHEIDNMLLATDRLHRLTTTSCTAESDIIPQHIIAIEPLV